MLSRMRMRQRKNSEINRTDRLLDSHGRPNISIEGVRGWKKRYVYDFFTTMVDLRWRWNLLIFIGGFVITWVIFAALYWIIGFFNGDYEEDTEEELHKPCIKNLRSFLSAYLFSIETQSTIGYGFFYVTEQCFMAYTCVLLQSILGAALQAALAGLVVAKVRRGRRDNNTILLSSFCCIFYDGLELKLVLRVADSRKIPAINANIKGYFFTKILSGEEKILSHQEIVEFSIEGGCTGLSLAWPQQIVHTINERSPLWNISKESLPQENFELLVTFFGEIATIGRPFDTTVSYLPCDIKWGFNFEPLDHRIDNEIDKYFVDVSNFNQAVPVPTPSCSAKQLKDSIERNSLDLPDYIKRNIQKPKPSPIFSRQNSVADKFLDAALNTNNENATFSALPQ